MQKLYLKLNYFTKNELRLWAISVLLIVGSFFIFDKTNYLTLIASLIGTTSLIFNAKGNSFGQLLMIVFSVLYGMISLSFKYYGEMITYLGMTGPMALFALISWLKNPYNGDKSEVKVNTLNKKEMIGMFLAAFVITFSFYFMTFQYIKPIYKYNICYY